jgi:hypothetical protein
VALLANVHSLSYRWCACPHIYSQVQNPWPQTPSNKPQSSSVKQREHCACLRQGESSRGMQNSEEQHPHCLLAPRTVRELQCRRLFVLFTKSSIFWEMTLPVEVQWRQAGRGAGENMAQIRCKKKKSLRKRLWRLVGPRCTPQKHFFASGINFC